MVVVVCYVTSHLLKVLLLVPEEALTQAEHGYSVGFSQKALKSSSVACYFIILHSLCILQWGAEDFEGGPQNLGIGKRWMSSFFHNMKGGC